MTKETRTLLPSLQRTLKALGARIRMARLRRKLPATLIAERAGISRNTLRAIEHGEPTVTLGAYASTLLSLGLEGDLEKIAQDDLLGKKLQDINLPIRARAPRNNLIKKKKSTQ